ncbi:hypothetical protein STANM309S_01099 [Streptomyces tanashiensis]
MRVRADAQHQHVEGRHPAVVAGTRGRGQLLRVRRSGGVDVDVRPVRGRHGMHPRRVERHPVEQRSTGLGDVPLGVALGQEPLVAPPQVEPRPVDRVPRGRRTERREQAVAVAAAGQHDRGGATRGLGVHDPGDEPGRGGLGHQLLVAVDDQLRGAHLAAFLAGAFFAAGLAAGAVSTTVSTSASTTVSTTVSGAVVAASSSSRSRPNLSAVA